MFKNTEFISSMLQRVSMWCATITVALIPLFFLPVQWATVAHAKFLLLSVGVGVGLFAAAGAYLLRGEARVPRSLTLIAIFLLPLAYVASGLVNGNAQAFSGIERDTVLASILWAGAFLLAVFGFQSRGRVLWAYRAFLVVASVTALFQIVRLAIGADILTFGGVLSGAAASILGTWHDLGIFLGFGVILSLAMMGSTHAYGVHRWFSWIVLVLSLAGLTLVNMTDVWILLGSLSALIAGYYVWSRYQEVGSLSGFAKHTTFLAFLATALISLGMVFAGSYIHQALPQHMQVSQVEVRPSWQGTLGVAASIYKTSGALFGSGPNTFMREWGQYKPAGVNETAFWNADFAQGVGFIPTTAATLGLVGLLAWFLFLGTFVFEAGRSFVRAARDAGVEPILLGLFGSALYLWAFHVIYPPGPAIMALAFLTSGLAITWAAHSGIIPLMHITNAAMGRVKMFATTFAVVVIGVGTLISSGFFVRSLVADMLVNKAIVTYNTTTSLAQADRYLNAALTLHPDFDRAHRASVELGILQLAELAQTANPENAAQVEQLRQAVATAINHGLAAVEADATYYQNWISLARTYEQLVGAQVEGSYEQAQQAYRGAIVANPTSPVPHLLLARLALLQNDVAIAEEEIARALEKKPNFAEAHFLRSQIAAALGRGEDAVASAEAAVLSAPQEPVAWFQLGTLQYDLGAYEKAIPALEQAVALNINYANALYVLSLSYAASGRFDEAARAMELVAVLNPNNEDIPSLIQQLRAQASGAGAAAEQEVSEEVGGDSSEETQ